MSGRDVVRDVGSPDGAVGGDEDVPPRAANWPMPNPARARLPHPHDYDATGPDVVADRVTGLSWQRALQTKGFYWPAAKSYCRDLVLGGRGDWRLPSLVELISIVDFSRVNPAIDIEAFPHMTSGTVWTSTPVISSPTEAWYVSFNNGFTYQGHQSMLAIDVRCVRGGEADAQAGRYRFPTPGIAADAQTGLVWQRKAPVAVRSFDAANRGCRALGLAGGGWRLPSIKELQTLVVPTRQVPALDPTAFAGEPAEQYWSSSVLAGSPQQAWVTSFRLGAAATAERSSENYVRCVR